MKVACCHCPNIVASLQRNLFCRHLLMAMMLVLTVGCCQHHECSFNFILTCLLHLFYQYKYISLSTYWLWNAGASMPLQVSPPTIVLCELLLRLCRCSQSNDSGHATPIIAASFCIGMTSRSCGTTLCHPFQKPCYLCAGIVVYHQMLPLVSQIWHFPAFARSTSCSDLKEICYVDMFTL